MAATARLPQNLEALAKANRIRLARAELHRQVFAGTITIRDVLKVHELPGVDTLADVDEAVVTLPVGELLTWPRRWGHARVAKTLHHVAVPESAMVGDLTSRRRRMIVAAVEQGLAATAAESQRIAERRSARERMAAARAAGRAREEAARQAAAETARADAERRAAELEHFPPELRVACPFCRSEIGDVCSVYEPVQDRWIEPQTHAERLDAAGLR